MPISAVDCYVHHRRQITIFGSLWLIGGSATASSSENAEVRFMDHDVIGGSATALCSRSAEVTYVGSLGCDRWISHGLRQGVC